MRPQILHQMMHRRLARIVNKTVGEPRKPSHTPNSDDLTARLALLSPLVALYQQFQEGHGSGKHGRDVRVERLSPDIVGPIVEVVIADFCGGRFGGWFGAGVGRGVEGCLAGVVDQEVDVACFGGDLVDGALEVGVGGCAALDWDEVAVFLCDVSLVAVVYIESQGCVTYGGFGGCLESLLTATCDVHFCSVAFERFGED